MGSILNERANRVYQEITSLYPLAHCELRYSNALELMIAIILSAQTTDLAVNQTTLTLFEKYHSFEDYIQADLSELEHDIRHLGLYKNKARSIQGMATIVYQKYQGVFPSKMKELLDLPGVGRKTANVFLSEWYKIPGIAVDTHVSRVSVRLGLAKKQDAVNIIEEKLMRKFPKNQWIEVHHKLIFFGRYFCKASSPNCNQCPLIDICKTPFPK
ncbi:MAG: endonuclease III [Firmicutes bacterium]|nr:endonuclease III [Bacillota bacterium]